MNVKLKRRTTGIFGQISSIVLCCNGFVRTKNSCEKNYNMFELTKSQEEFL